MRKNLFVRRAMAESNYAELAELGKRGAAVRAAKRRSQPTQKVEEKPKIQESPQSPVQIEMFSRHPYPD